MKQTNNKKKALEGISMKNIGGKELVTKNIIGNEGIKVVLSNKEYSKGSPPPLPHLHYILIKNIADQLLNNTPPPQP